MNREELNMLARDMAHDLTKGYLTPRLAVERLNATIVPMQAVYLAVEVASYLPDSLEREFRDEIGRTL